MARINIDDPGTGQLLGWFDPQKSRCFEEGHEYENGNRVGTNSGSQWIDELLFLTPGGRWVLNSDRTRYHNGSDLFRFVDAEEAREWLVRSGEHDDAVAELFGPIPDEAGPGRPAIGAAINVRYPDGLLSRIDQAAADQGITRAEWLRRAAQAALQES